jgi:predicted amidohydrolase YtcJ
LSAALAIINANIRTMNPNQPTAQALFINKNMIVRVGTNKQISQLINEKIKVLNFEGKTVIPGLIDTHIHVADFGRCLMWLDLTTAQSISELQSILKEKARQTPAGKWIVGRGWNQDRFKEKRMPKTSDLDESTPNNPVILYHETAMICAVNTKALELAGVTEQTLLSKGGIIEKNPVTGKLTGIFRDSATNLIWNAVPEPTAAELLEATALACQKISAAGITSVHWLVLSEVELEIIQNLNAFGRLPFRVNVVVPQELLEKTVGFKTNNVLVLRVGGATIAADGYLDSKEAALLEPYNDEPKNRGKLLSTEEELMASVAKVLAAGVQPIILAMGDKAIDLTLKVIEKTQKDNVRFRIEQAAVLNNDLIHRLKKQEVVVSVQPKVISTEFSVWSAIQRLGLERAKWLHPLKTLLNQGVKVVGGSDCPMEPLSPLIGIQEVVLRTDFPNQRLCVEEALRMYTLDAAYSSGEENVKGSIEEGKLADLTVLSDDPVAVEPEKIKDIKIEFTIIDGKILIV